MRLDKTIGGKGKNPRSRYITYVVDDEELTMCCSDWDVWLGFTRGTIAGRLRSSWSESQALGFSPPPQGSKTAKTQRPQPVRQSVRDNAVHTFLHRRKK